MIEYGSDYLLGLATFAPEKFAERDRLWATDDATYFALSDALQYLGNVAFRAPVPAYKHSAAAFLQITKRISTARTHPQSPTRPPWELEHNARLRPPPQPLTFNLSGYRSTNRIRTK